MYRSNLIVIRLSSWSIWLLNMKITSVSRSLKLFPLRLKSVFSDESVNLTSLELKFNNLLGFPGIYRYDSDHVLQKKWADAQISDSILNNFWLLCMNDRSGSNGEIKVIDRSIENMIDQERLSWKLVDHSAKILFNLQHAADTLRKIGYYWTYPTDVKTIVNLSCWRYQTCPRET